MRTITLPTLFELGGKPAVLCPGCGAEVVPKQAVTAANLLIQWLNPPTGKHIDVLEMALRVSLVQKLRKATTTLRLEDAEWEKLKECVEECQFVVVSEDITAVYTALVNAVPEIEQVEKNKHSQAAA